MAFCNSCGTTLQAGAKFCPKCGTANPEVATAVPASSPTAAPSALPAQKQTDLVRIILIVVAAVIVLGIIGVGAVTLIGLRIAHRTRVQQNGDNVRVQTPFGTVETSKDPNAVAQNLGVDVYPGARVLQDGAANVQMGSMHTVSVQMESDDSADKVADFYKSKLPDATVNVSGNGNYSIVSTDRQNLLTVNIESKGSGSLIHIASVSGKGVTTGAPN